MDATLPLITMAMTAHKLFFQIFLTTRFLLCHNMTILTMAQPPIHPDSQIFLHAIAHWNIMQVHVSGLSTTFTLHYISYVNSSTSCRKDKAGMKFQIVEIPGVTK